MFALYFTTDFRQFLNSGVDLLAMRTFKIFTRLLKYLFEQSLPRYVVALDLLQLV